MCVVESVFSVSFAMRFLISLHPASLNFKFPKNVYTLLMIAVGKEIKNPHELVKSLIELYKQYHGPNALLSWINEEAFKEFDLSQDALFFALENKHDNASLLLLENGAIVKPGHFRMTSSRVVLEQLLKNQFNQWLKKKEQKEDVYEKAVNALAEHIAKNFEPWAVWMKDFKIGLAFEFRQDAHLLYFGVDDIKDLLDILIPLFTQQYGEETLRRKIRDILVNFVMSPDERAKKEKIAALNLNFNVGLISPAAKNLEKLHKNVNAVTEEMQKSRTLIHNTLEHIRSNLELHHCFGNEPNEPKLLEHQKKLKEIEAQLKVISEQQQAIINQLDAEYPLKDEKAFFKEFKELIEANKFEEADKKLKDKKLEFDSYFKEPINSLIKLKTLPDRLKEIEKTTHDLINEENAALARESLKAQPETPNKLQANRREKRHKTSRVKSASSDSVDNVSKPGVSKSNSAIPVSSPTLSTTSAQPSPYMSKLNERENVLKDYTLQQTETKKTVERQMREWGEQFRTRIVIRDPSEIFNDNFHFLGLDPIRIPWITRVKYLQLRIWPRLNKK